MISLTATMGVVWELSLLRPRAWRGRGEFALLAIVGPSIIHNLFIGMPRGYFHICPTPFFGAAILTIAYPLPNWADRLRVESFSFGISGLAIVLFLSNARGAPRPVPIRSAR